MNPTIGRIVIVVLADGQEIPAIVTEVHSETTITASGFMPSGSVNPFSSIVRSDVAEAGGRSWKWPEILASAAKPEELMGGFNVLSLLGGDFGAIVGPLLVMLYNANKGRIEESADRVLTPPQSAINYILDRFGIKDPSDRAEFADALRVWGDKGGDALVLLSDLIAKKAGA